MTIGSTLISVVFLLVIYTKNDIGSPTKLKTVFCYEGGFSLEGGVSVKIGLNATIFEFLMASFTNSYFFLGADLLEPVLALDLLVFASLASSLSTLLLKYSG